MKFNALVSAADNDIKKRIGKKSDTLWENAIHHADAALSQYSDAREAVVALLDYFSDGVKRDVVDISDLNVVLAAVIFDKRTTAIAESHVFEVSKKISEKGSYGKAMIIAIRKATYEAVIDFLEAECHG